MSKRNLKKESPLFELIHAAYNHLDKEMDSPLKESLFQAAKALQDGKDEHKVMEELAPPILRFHRQHPNDEPIGALNRYLQKEVQSYRGLSGLVLNLHRIFH